MQEEVHKRLLAPELGPCACSHVRRLARNFPPSMTPFCLPRTSPSRSIRYSRTLSSPDKQGYRLGSMKSLQVAVITGAARGIGSAIAPAMTPLRRLGEPEDIAAAAVLFCSEDAGWITGECMRVSGGLV